MRKLYGILMLFALFGAAFAANATEIAAGKALVDSRVNCTGLSQDQLESIGEYFMELQHPGAAHDYMNNMMGGEGSQSLLNAHIQMAEVLYCGRTDIPVTYGGMMGLGVTGYGGMMGGYGVGAPSGYGGMMGRGAGQYGYGMMSNYGYGFGGWSIFDILLILLLIGLILVVYVHVWQKLKENKKGK